MNFFIERYQGKRIHFIGIGGIGMSGLARLLIEKGIFVSGSDAKDSMILQGLAAQGIRTGVGHTGKNVAGASLVVHSHAVKMENSELKEAIEQKIPIITRGELLAELMKDCVGIAVAGTHGKTSTTAMIAHLLLEGGESPTVVLGGIWDRIGSNARWGEGSYFVAEADESDESFLRLPYFHTIATNLEPEHLDHYGDEKILFDRFSEYLDHTPVYGSVIYCGDDSRLRDLMKKIHKPSLSYGMELGLDYRGVVQVASPEGIKFNLVEYGEVHDGFFLPVLGEHNLRNALAAIALARVAGLPMDEIKKALVTFSSVKRRMSHVGRYKNHQVYDDYAHHPTEVRATLDAIKKLGKKISLVFQPHRYTRTADQWESLPFCFELADELFLTPLYPAGEEPIEGISSERLLERVRAVNGSIKLGIVRDVKELKEALANDREESILLTMGAGDITYWGYDLIRHP